MAAAGNGGGQAGAESSADAVKRQHKDPGNRMDQRGSGTVSRMEKEIMVKKLKSLADFYMKMAKQERKENSGFSYMAFDNAEVIKVAADYIEKEEKRKEPATIEYEGDAKSAWWWVCSECHGVINDLDLFCKHCGKPLVR